MRNNKHKNLNTTTPRISIRGSKDKEKGLIFFFSRRLHPRTKRATDLQNFLIAISAEYLAEALDYNEIPRNTLPSFNLLVRHWRLLAFTLQFSLLVLIKNRPSATENVVTRFDFDPTTSRRNRIGFYRFPFAIPCFIFFFFFFFFFSSYFLLFYKLNLKTFLTFFFF